MSIITIPKKEHKSLDHKITALPAAYVGTNVIVGYKDIIRAINIAYNKTLVHDSSDPVQDYWEKSITQGMTEGDQGETPSTENENISKRFTDATKRRGDSYARRAPPRPGKGGDKPPEPKKMLNASNAKSPKHKNVKTTSAGSTDSGGSEYMSQNDPLSASNLEKDPLMAAFWRNSEITPGT